MGRDVSQLERRLFYRLILGAEASKSDFLSGEALGDREPRDREMVRLWRGISVLNTEAQARSRGRGMPWLGRFIAVLEIPDDGRITYQRTGTSRGHFTLWGDPLVLLRCVVRVVAV